MREIKFRGKMVGKNGINDWVFGHIQPVFTGMCIMQVCKYKTSSGIELFQIDENTVGQYTGLQDDKGIKIYEGDVLEIQTKDCVYQAVVVYVSDLASFFVSTEQKEYISFTDVVFTIDDGGSIKVIGNVFDDPKFKERFWTVWNQESNE